MIHYRFTNIILSLTKQITYNQINDIRLVFHVHPPRAIFWFHIPVAVVCVGYVVILSDRSDSKCACGPLPSFVCVRNGAPTNASQILHKEGVVGHGKVSMAACL